MKKKSLLLILMATFAVANLWSAPVGSIIKKGAPLDVIEEGKTPIPPGGTVDFKAATVDGKLWAKVIGQGYVLAANKYSSQVRIFTGGNKFEISQSTQGANYITPNPATLTTVVSAFPFVTMGYNFTQISVMQEDNNRFSNTATWSFDKTAPNSGLTGDTEKPVLIKAEPGTQAGASLPITFDATDNSGDFFYYVSDEANAFHAIFFDNTGTINGLKADTPYNFTVVAIDFSGNISDPITFSIGEKPYESVVEGIAGDVDFFIHSTANSFTFYGKPVDPQAVFHYFTAQVGTPTTVFTTGDGADPTPYTMLDNTTVFPGVTSFSSQITGVAGDANGIVRLNLAYVLGPLTEPVDQATWQLFYESIKFAGKLTTGPRAGEFLDFKLGDSSSQTGIKGTQMDGNISIKQIGETVAIISDKATSATLYSVNGQLVETTGSKIIGTSALAKGVYILKVKDAAGNTKTIKIAVK